VTREKLLDLIQQWMRATALLERIASVNKAGGSGDGLRPALDRSLDEILRLMEAKPVPDELPGNDRRGSLIACLNELESADRRHYRANVIYWAADLVRQAADLAAEYLIEESNQLAEEKP
jgi:hypothetical protein